MDGMGTPQQVRGQQQPQFDQVTNNSPARSPQPNETKWYTPTIESKIVVILIVTAAIVVLSTFIAGLFGGRGTSFVKENQYQAVFLSNGQVYFGNITKIDSQMFILEDIFYLQVDQQLQPDQGNNAQQQQPQPQVSLAKLGQELHGPEDQMFISAKDVVFWENLKDESQVVQAIQQYDATGETNPPAASTTPSSSDSTQPAGSQTPANDTPTGTQPPAQQP